MSRRPGATGEVVSESRDNSNRARTESSVNDQDAQLEARDAYLGVLQVLGNGAGFIRNAHAGYMPSESDIYVSQKIVGRWKLRSGDEIAGIAGKPPGNGKSPPLRKIFTVNGCPPETLGHRRQFNRLSAQHPDEQLTLECGLVRRGRPDYTNRIIDLSDLVLVFFDATLCFGLRNSIGFVPERKK